MLDMLELKDISFEVSGDSGSKEIIRNMNLLLPEGQVVALTGPNVPRYEQETGSLFRHLQLWRELYT